MSDYQTQLALGLFVAGVAASYGDGYQYQSLFYLLVVLFGGWSFGYFVFITFLYVLVCFISGMLRSTK